MIIVVKRVGDNYGLHDSQLPKIIVLEISPDMH